jgi:transcriptional regulator with XRE-family HTH domain
MPADTPFAVALRRLRERAGLSMAALADRAGLHRTHVWKLEAGQRPHPSWRTVQALAKALGVKVEVFNRG